MYKYTALPLKVDFILFIKNPEKAKSKIGIFEQVTINIMLLTRNLLLSAIALLFLSACSSDETTPVPELPEVNVDTVVHQEINAGLSPLPSPLEIAWIFKSSGLNYIDNVTFPYDKQSLFVTNFEKQLALGVYSADLTYCSLNGMRQEADNYFVALEELATDIGFGEPMSTEQNIERMRNNIDDIDSVGFLLTELHMNADRYFRENNEQDKAYVIFSAAWLESMYLGATTQDLESNLSLAEALFDQVIILEDLKYCLNEVNADNEDPNINTLAEHLDTIDTHLQAITNGSDDVSEIVISRAKLDALLGSIVAARNYITKSTPEWKS